MVKLTRRNSKGCSFRSDLHNGDCTYKFSTITTENKAKIVFPSTKISYTFFCSGGASKDFASGPNFLSTALIIVYIVVSWNVKSDIAINSRISEAIISYFCCEAIENRMYVL